MFLYLANRESNASMKYHKRMFTYKHTSGALAITQHTDLQHITAKHISLIEPLAPKNSSNKLGYSLIIRTNIINFCKSDKLLAKIFNKFYININKSDS